jgi:hypothetical protein
MNRLKRLFAKISNEPFYEHDLEASVNDEFERVASKGREKIDGIWNQIREMVVRGLSAGTLATLTLFGSQFIVGKIPKIDVWWTLLTFLLGLLFLLLRQFVNIWHSSFETKGDMDAIIDYGFSPPIIFRIISRGLDYLALIALVVGVCLSLLTLYQLSSAN